MSVTLFQQQVLYQLAWGVPTAQIGRLVSDGSVPRPEDQERGAAAIRTVLRLLKAKGRVQAVDTACRSALIVPPTGLRPPSDGIPEDLLRVAELLAIGMTRKEIAAHLDISIGAVKTRFDRLYDMLGVTTGDHAVFSLHAIGILPAHHPCLCNGDR
ncbi:LuxR C-terminal-related transcriptional regulator [Streptomyces sp. MJM8645]|uniref:helix-turn-helix transcriptional regulator n=1 Tax=Streptomycetaceae TaxID=2062 RepID=UPI0007AEF2DF|nr:LuxR C-terminal-related transcriptional regulator [Streptomyces sp. MJM8645]